MSDVDENRAELLRSLPAINDLLQQERVQGWLKDHPRSKVVGLCRQAVAQARERIRLGDLRPFDETDLLRAFNQAAQPNLRRVLNATGVVLHTNLGRAPLPKAALDRVVDVAQGYCNLELDLEEGGRGSRYEPVVDLLRSLTGAEDAVVVNNGAAAVLLALSAIAASREAVVSRGELVEIGGGFRIPDVMRQSGVRLVEVGTTNRTRLADYASALSSQTAVLMKVHRSNFAVVGFTEEVRTRELATLAHASNLPLYEDLGSGWMAPFESRTDENLSWEPPVRSVVSAGADLVSFSGDKLLGGPQAGIVVGRSRWVHLLKSHPLNRALRVDKMTVAALEATLELYRDERWNDIPALALLRQPSQVLEAKAEKLKGLLRQEGVTARVVPTTSQVGGGAMPLASPQSFACAVNLGSARVLQEKLREVEPPVIARIVEEALYLDVRCLAEGELAQVAAAVGSVLSELSC